MRRLLSHHCFLDHLDHAVDLLHPDDREVLELCAVGLALGDAASDDDRLLKDAEATDRPESERPSWVDLKSRKGTKAMFASVQCAGCNAWTLQDEMATCL